MSETEPAQDRAHRPLRNLHAETPLDDFTEVAPTPAHDAVRLRVRPRLDDLRERAHLRGVELGRASREGAVAETGQPFGVVTVNPVAQRLPVHAAALRRLVPTAPLKRKRQRQHPA